MEFDEFNRISQEEGFTDAEARWIWSAKPDGQEVIEDAVRRTSKEFLPFLVDMRLRSDHNEHLRNGTIPELLS